MQDTTNKITPTTKLYCGHYPSSGGVGYGTDKDGHTFCYTCCADNDRAQMDTNGRATLHLVKRDHMYTVTNWPGSLEYRVIDYRTSWHNMAGKDGRTDVWFYDHAHKLWHGYQIGHFTQICHCKRIK